MTVRIKQNNYRLFPIYFRFTLPTFVEMIFVRKISVFILLLISLAGKPQSIIYPVTVPYLYSARYSPEVTDPFTCVFNPATLPSLKGFAAGLYSERRFMTEGLDLAVLSAAFGGRTSGAGLLFRHFGNADYGENEIGINYGKALGNVSIGAFFNYQRFNVSGSPGQSVLNIGITSVWHISEKIFSGIRLINPAVFFIKDKERLRLPSAFSMGFGIQASSKVYCGIESNKEEGRSLQILLSVNYHFAEKFFTKFCWSTDNNQPYFSSGWRFNDFRIEAGCSYHMNLGATPSLVFIYQKQLSHREN